MQLGATCLGRCALKAQTRLRRRELVCRSAAATQVMLSSVEGMSDLNALQTGVVPESLRNPVAVLSVEKEGVATNCYVLGVSHVSKVSCQQVM